MEHLIMPNSLLSDDLKEYNEEDIQDIFGDDGIERLTSALGFCADGIYHFCGDCDEHGWEDDGKLDYSSFGDLFEYITSGTLIDSWTCNDNDEYMLYETSDGNKAVVSHMFYDVFDHIYTATRVIG